MVILFPERRFAFRIVLLTAFLALAAAALLMANRVEAHPSSLEDVLADLQDQWKRNERRGTTQLHLTVHASRIRAKLCEEGKTEYCPEQLLAGTQAKWQMASSKEEKDRLHHEANRLRDLLCKQKSMTHCLASGNLTAKNVDLDRLSYAVAVAETSNCTAGTGKSRNNCHGIFGMQNGKYAPLYFETTDESFQRFKLLWITKYGDRFPTLQDAQRYSGGPGDTWLERVTIAYNRER